MRGVGHLGSTQEPYLEPISEQKKFIFYCPLSYGVWVGGCLKPKGLKTLGNHFFFFVCPMVSTSFIRHNKTERISNGPHWALLAETIRGINIFKISKSRPEIGDFESGQNRFSKTIKWKEYQMDPVGFCFRRVHSGDKTLEFKKAS